MKDIKNICLKNNITEIENIINSSNINNIFINACKFESIKIINYLLSVENIYGQINIHLNNEEVFREACLNNNMELIKLLLTLEKTHKQIDIHIGKYELYECYGEECFKSSCKNGNIELVKLLLSLKNTHGKINIHNNYDEAFKNACYNEHLEIINYLISLKDEYGEININNVFESICLHSKLEIIKLLIFNDSLHKNILLHANNEKIFKLLCKYGKLDVIKYLVSLENIYGKFDIYHYKCSGINNCCSQLYNKDNIICKYNSITYACENGYIDVIKYLLSLKKIIYHNVKLFDICIYKYNRETDKKNYLEIIKILIKITGNLNEYKNFCINNNHLTILKLIK